MLRNMFKKTYTKIDTIYRPKPETAKSLHSSGIVAQVQ